MKRSSRRLYSKEYKLFESTEFEQNPADSAELKSNGLHLLDISNGHLMRFRSSMPSKLIDGIRISDSGEVPFLLSDL